MDFSRIGAVEADGATYCARAQPRCGGKKRQIIRGPYRPDQQAAQEDLESMRAAASGMSREDGFAAMKVEADALKAGKPPKEAGFIDRDGNGFRARVQYREDGAKRHIPRPWRTDEEAAKDDLVAIRAAASGMGRDEGVAAMAAEAKRRREGKPMTEGGCVKEIEKSYRAAFCWQDERDVKGPRRAEKRRAEEDLEALREASVGLADPEARRAALAAEAHRLQQQAETEQRVELFAHRLSQQQAHLQPSVGQQRQQQQPSVIVRQQQPVPEQQAKHAQSNQASEELSGSEDDWEVEEVDDGMVAYVWKSKDELLQQWDEQQSKELPLPPIPEPS